jgi:rfaE bifunctional protein kinase chain/domain
MPRYLGLTAVAGGRTMAPQGGAQDRPIGDATKGTHDVAAVIDRWQGRRVLVIGDIVADEQVYGRPLRIAREAPVLVLEHVGAAIDPGGATNVAANLAAMGASVQLAGVVGDDATGRALVENLAARGIDISGVVVDPTRPTTTKTRVWAAGAQQQARQMVVRLDRLDNRPLGPESVATIVAHVSHALAAVKGTAPVDAVVISDYENGVIHPDVIAACLPVAKAREIPVVVDAHGGLDRFRGATIFTPNQPEAEAELGRSLTTENDVKAGAWELLNRLHASAILVTRGQQGMTLVVRQAVGDGTIHVPAPTMAAVDPTGAGDTVAAAFTLAWVSGANPTDAARLATAGAAVAVAHAGTVAVTAAEVREAIARVG